MIKPNWILQRTKLSPDKIALIDIHTDERWTYADLENEIMIWVKYFQEKNCSSGDRIVVLSHNQKELFAIMFACGLLGLMYVPLNWRLSEVEWEHLLRDSEAKLLIYDKTYKEQVSKFTFIEKVALQEKKDEITVEIALPEVKGEDPWLMIYTGGTTGKPKGVVISHQAVNTNAINTITSWSLNEEDITINYMPLFHTGGINALSMPILMAGGVVVVGHKFEPDEALRATNRYQATISLFVPTMYQAMIETEYFKQSNFPSMRVFLSGGAPCPPKIYDTFRRKGLAFKEGYGLTEAGPNNFFIRPELAKEKIGSVGKNMLFNEVTVVRQDGTPCDVNEVGELYLKGNHLFTAYWNQEEETKAVFAGEWFKTGDLAKFDEDGDYYIVGRKKDMIITGGENVYPQEVEHCLLSHPMIDEAAVIGVPDEKWGEKVVAFVSVTEGNQFEEELVKDYCKQSLGSYKVPKQFFVIDQLPKTDVGKIDKNELLHLFQKNTV